MIDQAAELRKMAVEQSRKPTKVITVASGKGGVGKTSVSLNLAIALSRRGHRVLIIDSDFGFSNIDVMLGVNTKYDLLDVVNNNTDIHQIIEMGIEGVRFVSGGSGVYEMTQLSGEQLMYIVNRLKDLEDVADIIIFDTSAGVSENMLNLIYASHETIIVTTTEPTAVVDAYALVKIIGEQGKSTNISLIINRVSNTTEAASVMDCLVRIAEKNVDIQISKLGYIANDTSMQKAIRMQVPILNSFPNCTASANINEIAAKLVNIPVCEPERLGIKSFLERLFSNKSQFMGKSK